MKRKVGETKKAAAAKIFLPKTSSYRRDLIIAAVIILGGVFLVKRSGENVNTVSMVEEASGLDMNDSPLLPL